MKNTENAKKSTNIFDNLAIAEACLEERWSESSERDSLGESSSRTLACG